MNKKKHKKKQKKKKRNKFYSESKEKLEIVFLIVSVSSPQINGGYPDPTVIFFN